LSNINKTVVIISLIGNETFCEICKKKRHLHKSKKEGEAAPANPDDPNAPANSTEGKPERHHRRHSGT
jgi:hypothetical protein